MVVFLSSRALRRIAVAFSLVFLVFGAHTGVKLSRQKELSVVKIAPLSVFTTGAPYVGLAVDVTCCEAAPVDECLLALENLGIFATWFASTTFVESCSPLVKKIAELGHEFGIKGSDEKSMDRLAPGEIEERLKRSYESFAKENLEPVPFFLPPGGKLSDTLVGTAFRQGFHAIKPGIDARAMKGKVEKAPAKLMKSVRPGALIIIKVDKKGMVPAEPYLKALVDAIGQNHLRIVKLSELVKDGS